MHFCHLVAPLPLAVSSTNPVHVGKKTKTKTTVLACFRFLKFLTSIGVVSFFFLTMQDLNYYFLFVFSVPSLISWIFVNSFVVSASVLTHPSLFFSKAK